jgi:hypothetical protein
VGWCAILAASDLNRHPPDAGLADTENYNSPSKHRLPRIAALAPFLPFYVVDSLSGQQISDPLARAKHTCLHGVRRNPDDLGNLINRILVVVDQ